MPFSVMEKGGVAVKLCSYFGKVLVIFPYFFHANAQPVPKPSHNRFLPNFFISSFISRPNIDSTKREQGTFSDPVPSITPL
jgi:hypothetical protein